MLESLTFRVMGSNLASELIHPVVVAVEPVPVLDLALSSDEESSDSTPSPLPTGRGPPQEI